MARTITIDPVTRIEGHAHITLHLDDADEVDDARFHLTQFRGFEKFCEGRPFPEMPALTARTCGICPVSHLVASSKACDELLSVTIPPTAAKLRRIMNLAQIAQSHALSFFHLSVPRSAAGLRFRSSRRRNIFGLLRQNPQLARDGIRLATDWSDDHRNSRWQEDSPWLDGAGWRERTAHGGKARRDSGDSCPEGLQIAERTYRVLQGHGREVHPRSRALRYFPDAVSQSRDSPRGRGTLRRTPPHQGRRRQDYRGYGTVPTTYQQIIGEAVESFSYMKFPYYVATRLSQGIYRVGPLARLNNCDFCGTPLADAALKRFEVGTDGIDHQQFSLPLRPVGRDHYRDGATWRAAQGSGYPARSRAGTSSRQSERGDWDCRSTSWYIDPPLSDRMMTD